MTIDQLIKIASAATQVVGWYPHEGGDCYGPAATVRGPFFRWFTVRAVAPEYEKHVSSDYADAQFAAAAMNNFLPMLHAMKGMMGVLEEVSDTWEWCDDMQKMKRTKEAELAVEALAAARKAVGHV